MTSLIHPSSFLTNSISSDFLSIDRHSCVDRSYLQPYISIGCFSYVTRAKVGSYVSIGSRVSVGGFNHEYQNTFSTFGLESFRSRFLSGSSGRPSSFNTVIEPDVWIGDNTVVLSGVNLGVGCIVGAGSVVTKTTEPYTINVGNPSRPIKHRFDMPMVASLLRSRWWLADDLSTLADFVDLPPAQFLEFISTSNF